MSLSLENITEVFRTKEHNRDTDTDIDIHIYICIYMGFLGGSDGKASARTAGGPGLIPRSGRSPGEGNGNPLQYSCLENSMDGGAWWATVHRVAKSWTRFHFHFLSAWMHRLPSCSRQQEAEMSTARSVTAREPEAR